MKTLKQANIKPGSKILVSCDLDVKEQNTFRLEHALNTLLYIIHHGGKPIICGHMGQPHGIYDETLSTKQLEPFFDKHLGTNNYELLENLRFDIREEQNDLEFAKELASKAEIYVNESFATSHRKHASLVSVPTLLPSYAGFRLEEEINVLSKALINPHPPVVILIGGIKIESKKPVIDKFLNLGATVLVGGKIGKAWTENIPNSLKLPIDYAKGNKDIGPKTIAQYKNEIESAKTLIWSGPMGLYEEEEFSIGTKKLAFALTQQAALEKPFSIVGGGDTISALQKFNLLEKIDFVSTGGSAMLKFLTDETLVGIEALK